MTEQTKPNLDEIATAEKDYDLFSGYLNYLPNPDKVLQLELGGDIRKYDDIGRDTHVAGELRTRTLAVVGKEWDVVPGTEGVAGAGSQDQTQSQKIADYVKQVFLSFQYDTSRRAILRGGVLKGFAVSEIMWEISEGDIFIKDMLHRSQHRFVFTPRNELRLLTMQNLVLGEEVPEKKFQVLTFGDETTTPHGVGLGRELYWPWWFKKNGIKFWLIFCDKFGSPTPIGKYPSGALPEQKKELLAACEAIQTDAGIIHPDTMSLELLEAARAGSINTYESLCNFMNEEMSKSILGQTLTTQVGDTGSYAASQTHNEVRLDIVKADADILCGALNQKVIRWLVDYQFGPQKWYPKMWINCDPGEDLKVRSEVDKAIFDMGYRPTQEYIQETYSVEVEDVGVNNNPNPFPMPPKNFSDKGNGRFSGNQQTIEDLIGKVIPDASKALDKNEEMILNVIRNSSNYEEATATLQKLNLNMDAFEQMIERSALAALIFGKYAVKGEIHANP